MEWGETEQWVVTDCDSLLHDDWGSVLGQKAGCSGDVTYAFSCKLPGQVSGQERVIDNYLFFM